jgi:DnaJ-class molecular chaperone
MVRAAAMLISSLLLLLLCQPAQCEESLYKTLEVDQDATNGQIKKAYRKLSLKYHPDKNQGSADAKEKFDAVRDAYEILSDRKKRSVYDTGGTKAVKDAVQKKQQGGGRDMFGRKVRRKPAMQLQVTVSLRDMYVGTEFKHTIKRTAICRGCKNSNKKKCKKCGRCPDEIKMVQRQMGPGFMMNQQVRVPSEEKCKKENHELVAMIEKGMADGSEIWFEGEADEAPGQEPGDILMRIVQSPDNSLTREGDDLHMTQKINLKEALLGFEKSFKHLDGHVVELSSTNIIKPFQVIKIKGEGMPKVRRVCLQR